MIRCKLSSCSLDKHCCCKTCKDTCKSRCLFSLNGTKDFKDQCDWSSGN